MEKVVGIFPSQLCLCDPGVVLIQLDRSYRFPLGKRLGSKSAMKSYEQVAPSLKKKKGERPVGNFFLVRFFVSQKQSPLQRQKQKLFCLILHQKK